MRKRFLVLGMLFIGQMAHADEAAQKACLDYQESANDMITICNLALNDDVTDAEQKSKLLGNLGYAQYQTRAYDVAKDTLNSAIELWPENRLALSDLGWLHWRIGELKSAQSMFQKSIDLKPNSSNLSGMASVLSKLGQDRDKAIEMIQAARVIQPENAWYAAEEGWIYIRFDEFETAKQYFLEVKPDFPDELDIELGLGIAYSSLRENDAAIETLTNVLNIQPDNVRAMVELAYVYRNQDKFEEALALSDEILVIRPGYDNAIVQRAWALHNLGREAEALSYLTAEYEKQSENAYMIDRLSFMMAENKKWEDQIALLESAVARGFQALTSYQDLTYAALQIADDQKALDWALKGAEIYPQDGLLPLNRAYAHLALGDEDATYEALQLAAQLGRPKKDFTDFSAFAISKKKLGIGLKASGLAKELD